MSEEQPTDPIATDVAPADVATNEPARAEPPAQDPRRRLKELLAIPDHQRSDAIWDEIIELEISLAPGNRINPGGDTGAGRRPQGQHQGRRQDQPRREGPPGNKPSKRFFKKGKRSPGAQPKT